MPNPRVSVLIVNYHAYPELTACLDSLARQTDRSPQVIVVDYTEPEARQRDLAERFPNIRFLQDTPNRGFATGINRAASHARGEFLLILNPDSLPDAILCVTLAGWLDRHPDVGAVGPLVRDRDGRIQASARRFPTALTGIAGRRSWLTRVLPQNPLSRRNLLTGDHVREPITVDWVSGACVMVRRSAFEAIGGMDQAFFLYWEDADLCRRLANAGWRTMYHPGTSVVHLGGRATEHAQTTSVIAFHRSAFRYYWKHGGLMARALAPLAWLVLNLRLGLKLLARRS